ncbi:Putative fluoride ion transporter CrcB [Candidatus Hydrogenisulfobacillus filiaventi]|uniref:Fluoride-specific ion channel FluC n=1 Tax=Candidatus Hydrogenisulfobacillus filiaventi TaxID=2707344 RepID=A0A6F8ZHX8_9FIRM|nr:fluoride efflux transporter CrcB [Bacillota bacterium]CAB1129323.1 Putative fluoride ion transporter CrcB [Candidatus Hydrogenisulfobacillus filiaventi]
MASFWHFWGPVALGGALGSLARYHVGRLVGLAWGRLFPLGTWIINVSGSFAIGLTAALAARHVLAPAALQLTETGFIGAYTTFSTFSYETVRLVEQRLWRTAAANLLLSAGAGLAAAGGGLAAGGWR